MSNGKEEAGSQELILEAENVSKAYPGVQALDAVKINLKKAEIHGLVGENGAGKSTLIHIFGGICTPDSCKIFIKGKRVEEFKPHKASEYGIGVVFQELSLVNNMSIAENIFVNRQPVNKFGFIDKKKLNKRTEELLDIFDLKFDPDTKVGSLSTGDRQLIEILKALSKDPEVLILDEPTSSLSRGEIDRLFNLLLKLKDEGMAIIYISHRLQEVFDICDRVSVLRDGKYVGTEDVENVNENDLVKMMVGKELDSFYASEEKEIGEKYFEIKNFSGPDFNDINISLFKGEILGVFGLVGSGRTELAEAIFGIGKKREGEIILNGESLKINKPIQAMRNGISYLTEDRHSKGLLLNMNIKENLVSSVLRNFARGSLGLMQDKKIGEFSREIVKKYNIVTPTIEKKVRNLSGGNQQKVLLGKWVGTDPEVLIVDEPTRGVDVGAKQEIYRYLNEISDRGIGIILISSDLPEVINISDRILVMREGEIAGCVPKNEATKENILAYAAGATNSGGNNRDEK